VGTAPLVTELPGSTELGTGADAACNSLPDLNFINANSKNPAPPETGKMYSSSIDSQNETREEMKQVLTKDAKELAMASRSHYQGGFKKYQGVLVGELTKQRMLKEKERVKGALMAQYNSDLADVVVGPNESKRERDLSGSTAKGNKHNQ